MDQSKQQRPNKMEYDHKMGKDAAKLKMKLVNDMHEFLKPTADIIDRHEESEISSFYANRSVFITGASGFVGKVSLCYQLFGYESIPVAKTNSNNILTVCFGKTFEIVSESERNLHTHETEEGPRSS